LFRILLLLASLHPCILASLHPCILASLHPCVLSFSFCREPSFLHFCYLSLPRSFIPSLLLCRILDFVDTCLDSSNSHAFFHSFILSSSRSHADFLLPVSVWFSRIFISRISLIIIENHRKSSKVKYCHLEIFNLQWICMSCINEFSSICRDSW
jgi:hypothetical protein